MIVVIYSERGVGVQVEGGHHTLESALDWIAEDPLPANSDGLYQLWDVRPGPGSPQMVRELWPRQTRDLTKKRTP